MFACMSGVDKPRRDSMSLSSAMGVDFRRAVSSAVRRAAWGVLSPQVISATADRPSVS